ncbi:MAG TPA: hypothetical protein PKE45_21255, partial [Caldilineaceae bacterium]|nr:hypothetical protein [Caldilineaceae bacterium]
SLEQKLAQVEAFYAAHQQPARYQISPAAEPADLDQRLAERGYRQLAITAVQATELTNILQHTQPLRLFPEFEVEVAEAFDEEWFAAFTAVEHAGEPQNETR